MAHDYAVVLFEDQQQYRVLRFELLESLSGNEVKVGQLVNAREQKNSILERANFLFKGSMKECRSQHDSFVKKQMKEIPCRKSSKKKVDQLNKQKIADENVALVDKLAKLTNDFDELFAEFNKLKEMSIEKDREISSLRILIEELEESKNAANLNAEFQQACNSCEQIATDVAEMNKKLNILPDMEEKLSVLMQLCENNQNKSAQFESNGPTRLGPKSNIYVNRTRFITADSSSTPTAFAQRILTAVFTYDEIIGASMTGKSTKSRKRRLVQKSLPEEKLTDLIATINLRYQGDPGLINVRKDIGWKVSSLNNGTATQNDILHWEGYNKEDFETLSSKKATTDSAELLSQDSTNASITTNKQDSPMNMFSKMSD